MNYKKLVGVIEVPRDVKKEGYAENAHAELREIMKSLDDSAHDGSRYCLTKKIEISLLGGLDVTYRIMSHLEAGHTVQQIISDMCNHLSIVLCQMKKILDQEAISPDTKEVKGKEEKRDE